MDPLTGSLITGGLSAVSGLLGSASGSKANKKARLQHMWVEAANRAALEETNAKNKTLGLALLRTPVRTEEVLNTTVTQRTSGGVDTSYREWGDVDVDAMMAAAEKAGFNPATWLNAGALSAYTRRNSETKMRDTTRIQTTTKGKNVSTVYGSYADKAYGLMSPQTYQTSAAPQTAVASPAQAIVGGIADGFKYYSDGQIRQDNQDFQRGLLNLSLDAASKRLLAPGVGGGNVGGASTNGLNGALSAIVKGLGQLTMPKTGDRNATNPNSVGSGWKIDPTVVDAEQGETRYGDIAQELFGIKNAISDTMYNMTGLTAPERWQKTQNWYSAVKDYVGGLGANIQNKVKAPVFTGSWMQ